MGTVTGRTKRRSLVHRLFPQRVSSPPVSFRAAVGQRFDSLLHPSSPGVRKVCSDLTVFSGWKRTINRSEIFLILAVCLVVCSALQPTNKLCCSGKPRLSTSAWRSWPRPNLPTGGLRGRSPRRARLLPNPPTPTTTSTTTRRGGRSGPQVRRQVSKCLDLGLTAARSTAGPGLLHQPRSPSGPPPAPPGTQDQPTVPPQKLSVFRKFFTKK